MRIVSADSRVHVTNRVFGPQSLPTTGSYYYLTNPMKFGGRFGQFACPVIALRHSSKLFPEGRR